MQFFISGAIVHPLVINLHIHSIFSLNRVLLCSLGYQRTCSEDQTRLELAEASLSLPLAL